MSGKWVYPEGHEPNWLKPVEEQDHYEEEKKMPFPNGGYLGPEYVITGLVILAAVFIVVGIALWRYFT